MFLFYYFQNPDIFVKIFTGLGGFLQLSYRATGFEKTKLLPHDLQYIEILHDIKTRLHSH